MALLQRVRLKPTPCSSTLTHEQRAALQECILLIRAEITTLQDRINASFSNLLTIVRCINSRLPHLQSHFYSYRYGITLDDFQNVVEVLGEKYACRPFQSSKLPGFANPAFEALAAKGEAAFKLQDSTEAEKDPKSKTFFLFTHLPSGFMPMVSVGGKLQAELNLLVLQRAEMAVEADRFEEDLLFWGNVWEDIQCASKLNAVQLRLKEGEMRDSSRPSRMVLRKEVPIREMLKRAVENPPQQEKLALGRSDSGIEMEVGEERYFDCVEAF